MQIYKTDTVFIELSFLILNHQLKASKHDNKTDIKR
jgi:hypothetical protein